MDQGSGALGLARVLGPIHLVGAWAARSRLMRGQFQTSEKSNEITAIPELLEPLDLGGCIVTIDAMGCQKAIAAKTVERVGDYGLQPTPTRTPMPTQTPTPTARRSAPVPAISPSRASPTGR